VITRRISFGTRTEEGSRAFALLASVIAERRKGTLLRQFLHVQFDPKPGGGVNGYLAAAHAESHSSVAKSVRGGWRSWCGRSDVGFDNLHHARNGRPRILSGFPQIETDARGPAVTGHPPTPLI